MKKILAISVLFLALCILSFAGFEPKVKAQGPSTANSVDNPIHVTVGFWLINVEKIDLAANTYRMDFYMWFNFNSSQISTDQMKQFEFTNGNPTVTQIDANESYLEYRVRGDFIKNFDFTMYPFESHDLSISIEHQNLDASTLIYEIDSASYVEPTANVAGWNLGTLQTQVTTHSYGDSEYSRPVFSVSLSRPLLSAFIKTVLPIAVITVIGLLAFAMAAEDFSQKIALGVTTLLAATAFHLSLASSIPPTGYMTFADKIMIAVYALFLYNIAVSVYIMRLIHSNRQPKATSFNSKALKFLPALILVLAIAVFFV